MVKTPPIPTPEESFNQRSLAIFNELSRMTEAAKGGRPTSGTGRDEDIQRRMQQLAANHKTVKSSGTFFPQAGKPDGM